MHRLHYTLAVVTISGFGLSGCSHDSPERLCYEATLAYAQATAKFINAEHETSKDAWLKAHLAAKWWMEKACPKPNN